MVQDYDVKMVALVAGNDFTLRDQGKLKQEVARVKRTVDLGGQDRCGLSLSTR